MTLCIIRPDCYDLIYRNHHNLYNNFIVKVHQTAVIAYNATNKCVKR